MTALALLTELRKRGVAFIAEGNRLRVIAPKGLALPEAVKAEIVQRKEEILARLHCGGIGPELVADVFPGAAVTEPANGRLRQPEIEAVTWLRSKLAPGPQHIARLCAAWVGSLSAPTGRDLDALMEARWRLKVEAFIGPDDRFMWRLPTQPPVQ